MGTEPLNIVKYLQEVNFKNNNNLSLIYEPTLSHIEMKSDPSVATVQEQLIASAKFTQKG